MDKVYKLTEAGKRTKKLQTFFGYIALFLIANLILFLILKYAMKINLNIPVIAFIVIIMLLYVSVKTWNNEGMKHIDEWHVRLNDQEAVLSFWHQGSPTYIRVPRNNIVRVVESRGGLMLETRTSDGGFFIPSYVERYDELKQELLR